MFDGRWYAAHHPDVARSRLPPVVHYLRRGRAELRRPNERFDPRWYLEQHPDVRSSGMDPVDHWWFHGAREGRDPSPEFDTVWYVAEHPDVRRSGVNPLLHWLRFGRADGRPTRPPEAVVPETPDPALPEAPPDPVRPPDPDGPPRVSADVPDTTAWPDAPPAPFLPAGAVRARADPALVDVPIVLGQPTLERDARTVTVRCPLGDDRAFWIRVTGPAAILDRIEARVEPFIAPALLVAGQERRPLRIEPALDPVHARRLRLELIPLVGAFTADADIIVGRTTDPRAAPGPAPTDVVALAFSGGVDSFHALQRMRAEGWPPNLLLSIDAGASDTDLRCRDRRRERVRWVADQLGVPMVTIDTNLHHVAWVPHGQAHAFRDLGAAAILQPSVGTLVYSSGHRVEVTSFPVAHGARVDFMEPLTFAAMRWGGMEIHPVGIDRGKADKIAGLVDDPLAQRALDVCVDQGYQGGVAAAPTNCGACFECARTLLTLEHLGALDRFGACFDLTAYASVRTAQLTRLAASDNHLDNDARQVLARPLGTRPPLVRGWLPPGPGEADGREEHDGPAPRSGGASAVTTPLTLASVTADRQPGRTRLTCPLGDGRSFWIEVAGPDAVLDALEPRLEPFIPPTLLLALLEDRPVRITPPLAATYVRRLTTRLMPTMGAVLSDHDVEVTVAARADADAELAAPGGGIALLFSGGVDSFAALHRMTREGWPPDLLVNLNAGAHDLDRVCWHRRLERVAAVAAEIGVPLVAIDTNLHELAWKDHALAHAFRNLPAASVLRRTTGTLVYSSGHRLEVTSLLHGRALGQDLVEPLTAETMRWGGLEITLVGNDVRKIDKVATIADLPLAWRSLDVCTDQSYQATSAPGAPTNCGRCGKCSRTLLTLEHLGVVERFAAAFDMDSFAAGRAAAMERLMARDHPIDDEFRQLLTMPRGTLPPFTRGTVPPRSAQVRPTTVVEGHVE